MTGAALALLAGACAEVVWLGVLTARELSAPMWDLWPRRQMAAIAIAYVAGFGAARAASSAMPGIAGLPAALAAGTLVYGLALVAAGGVNGRDRDRAKALVARLRQRSRFPSPVAP
jgi:hypothetical protein